jgi:hypothetical protein
MLSELRKGLSPELLQGIRALSFLLFVLLAIRVRRAADPAGRHRRVQQLLGYVLAMSVAVVLLRTDDWPFSPYPMMAVDATDHTRLQTIVAFRAVDRDGREWLVEPLAWSPLFPQTVMWWYESAYPFASPADREAAAKFLLVRAESARQDRFAARRVGNERWLGPLAAPDMNILGDAPKAPAPFVALRVYRLFWHPTELAADPQRFGRRLLFEWRQP